MTSPTLTTNRAFGIDELFDDWTGLLARCRGDTIFLTPEWQIIWWKLVGEGELHLVAVRVGRDLVGVSPLVCRGSQWELSGGVEVADFLDVIAAPGFEREVPAAVLDYLSRAGGTVELPNLRPSSLGAVSVRAEALRRGIPCWLEPEDVSPRVALPEDWEWFLESLTKKDRHELRRKMRRLLSSGIVNYFTVSDPSTRTADIQDFFRLCRLSADEFTSRGWLRLYFLELDGIRIASAILFDYRGEFLLYNSGYDPTYAHLSVGLLLQAMCLRDAISEGRRGFDFLQGNEPYKYDLGAVDVPILRLRLELGPLNGVVGGNHHV